MVKYLQSVPPTYDNGSLFAGFRVPAAQTFTSYSPSSDMNAYMQQITGLSGYKQRNLLQSQVGSQILAQSASGELSNSSSYLGFPGYHSKAACQTDQDCTGGQICYAFNEQVFGPQPGPTCSNTVYPEVSLGNAYNQGAPLRQESNYCYSDQDCQGIDKFTGKKKVGMTCNHFYKGPDLFEKNGMCQVQYESGGKRYHLKTPPGWTWPLNQPLLECNDNTDCGPDGVNGWVRCAAGADDGKKYCLWPGQTNIPTPRDLEGTVPQGVSKQPAPTAPVPSGLQAKILDSKSRLANRPGMMTPGGTPPNVQGPPVAQVNSLVSKKQIPVAYNN